MADEVDYSKFAYFSTKDDSEKNFLKCHIDKDTVEFYPPMYTQRYGAVHTILNNINWTGKRIRLVDLGCGSLSLFLILRYCDFIEEYIEIDKDENALLIGATIPDNYYSVSEYNRPFALTLLVGNVKDQDIRTKDVDAVVCIEMIEHLEDEELKRLPFTVFGFMKPKLAIFTTPNFEFNVLFPNRRNKYRVDDHKFEWTRSEFANWSSEVISVYPEYEVKHYGIGPGPEGTHHLGFCSQMAVFTCKSEKKNRNYLMNKKSFEKANNLTPYKLIFFYIYRWYDENLSDLTRARRSVHFYIRYMIFQRFCCSESVPAILQLSDLVTIARTHCTKINSVRQLLKNIMFTSKYRKLVDKKKSVLYID